MKKKTKLILSSLASLAPLSGLSLLVVTPKESKATTSTPIINETIIQEGTYWWIVIIVIVVLVLAAIISITSVVILQSKKNKRHKEEIDIVYLSLTEPEQLVSKLPYAIQPPKRLYLGNNQNALPPPSTKPDQKVLHQKQNQVPIRYQSPVQNKPVTHPAPQTPPPQPLPTKVELNTSRNTFSPKKK